MRTVVVESSCNGKNHSETSRRFPASQEKERNLGNANGQRCLGNPSEKFPVVDQHRVGFPKNRTRQVTPHRVRFGSREFGEDLVVLGSRLGRPGQRFQRRTERQRRSNGDVRSEMVEN